MWLCLLRLVCIIGFVSFVRVNSVEMVVVRAGLTLIVSYLFGVRRVGVFVVTV